MGAPLPLTGGCACGAVRYRSTGAPLATGHCHCRSCQRESGTDRGSHLMLAKAATEVSGEVRFFDTPADSGNMVSRGFCPRCGSPVVSRNTGFPDALFVRAASLDDPDLFRPQMVVFRAEAPAWAAVHPELPAFDGMPEEAPRAAAG